MHTLFHYLPTLVLALITAGLSVYVVHLRRLFTRENPTVSGFNLVRREVEELSGLLADLEGRFTRFQKREGMRVARTEKERADEMRAEAQRILTEGLKAPAEGQAKLDLYRRLQS